MNKNFLNKSQKKILYKNIGFLFVLIVLCSILIRSGILTGGETLADLAEEQEQAARTSPETFPADDVLSGEAETAETESYPSEQEPAASEGETTESEQEATPSESDPDQPKEEETPTSEQQKGASAMEDRVTYKTGFYYESLSDTVKADITGISYPADDSNAAISYDTLRYVNILYYDFNGKQQSGELICHKAIAQDLVEIFYELYEAQYPIEKIALVDEYQGDDSLSMQDNNTSCFNYRALPSGKLSNHAYGLAVDLNPFYNPYITYNKDGSVNITPAGSENYADREQDFEHKISKEDLAYELFIQHGFTWGGSWKSCKDYQHFEKAI